jgi:hypothetical protein
MIITSTIPLLIFLDGFSMFLPAVENTSNPANAKKQELKAPTNPLKVNDESLDQYCILLFAFIQANTTANKNRKKKAPHLTNPL